MKTKIFSVVPRIMASFRETVGHRVISHPYRSAAGAAARIATVPFLMLCTGTFKSLFINIIKKCLNVKLNE